MVASELAKAFIEARATGNSSDTSSILAAADDALSERRFSELHQVSAMTAATAVERSFEQMGLRDYIEGDTIQRKVFEISKEYLEGQALKKAQKAIAKDPRIAVLGNPTGGLQRIKPIGKLKPDPLTGVIPAPHLAGSYVQNFEYGSMRVRNNNGNFVPEGETVYKCDVFLAAAKCFGSEDEGGLFDGGEGEDEPYLIVTVINPTEFFQDGPIARVWRSPVFEEIEKGSIFGENLHMFSDLTIGRHGLLLKIALLDQEHGDPETVRAKIEELAKQAAQGVKDIFSALSGVSIDEALKEQDLDNGILDTLGDITLSLLTDLLDDDKIDEKLWQVPPGLLRDWVDNGTTATSFVPYPPSELPSHMPTNFPNHNVFDPSWLFAGGGGTYKIYLRLLPYKQTREFRKL